MEGGRERRKKGKEEERERREEINHKTTKQLNRKTGTGKMAQWLKKLAAKPNEFNPWKPYQVGENQLPKVVLTYLPTHTEPWYTVDDSI